MSAARGEDRDSGDPHDLRRFVTAQDPVYGEVIGELRAGRKRTHWMWFVFPQIEGLGTSPTARHYAIRNLAEASAYLDHDVLGARLQECTEAVADVRDRSALEIFGSPDNVKFRSCMTLFEIVAGADSVYSRAIANFFDGERDARTIERIDQLKAEAHR